VNAARVLVLLLAGCAGCDTPCGAAGCPSGLYCSPPPQRTSWPSWSGSGLTPITGGGTCVPAGQYYGQAVDDADAGTCAPAADDTPCVACLKSACCTQAVPCLADADADCTELATCARASCTDACPEAP
jgi:hypothetical protein